MRGYRYDTATGEFAGDIYDWDGETQPTDTSYRTTAEQPQPGAHRHVFDAATNTWGEGDQSAALAAAADTRRAELRAACQAAITAGISHDVLGAPHTYPTTVTDQANLAGLVSRARELGDSVSYKFWCADASGTWARRAHTAAQIIAVGLAVSEHVIAQQDRYEQRLQALDAATTLDEIAAVVW